MHVNNPMNPGWFIILICLTLTGCASTGAPDGWLPVAAAAPKDPYGSWVTIEFQKGSQEAFLVGEFLAVDRDSLYVLAPYYGSSDPIRGVSLDTIKKAKIASFDPETGKAVGWVAMGSLASLSHGLGAAISIPLWMIMGGALAGGQSRTALENYPDLSWSELRMYSRFPQGPPSGLHQLDLQPKPHSNTTSFPGPETRDIQF